MSGVIPYDVTYFDVDGWHEDRIYFPRRCHITKKMLLPFSKVMRGSRLCVLKKQSGIWYEGVWANRDAYIIAKLKGEI